MPVRPSSGLRVLRRMRDLTVLTMDPGRVLVVACDSVGGIGPKKADSYAVSAGDCAHFATRVPLLEVLAVGAEPVLIIDALAVERDPTGNEMIAAVAHLAEEVGLDPELAVTGSTEDNVPTNATGVGVTVLGVADSGGLRAGRSRPGDLVVCLGLPLSAPTHALYPGHPQQIAIKELVQVLDIDSIHDVLPVGSRGVAAEMQELATSAGLEVVADFGCGVDFDHSGGPASCVIVSCAENAVQALVGRLRTQLPVTVVGSLRERAQPA